MNIPIRPLVTPEYLKNLEKLAEDTSSADYTIACSGSEFKVHKHVSSLHSEYFVRLFNSQYRESSTNRIDLVEDPKTAVENMVQYFYKFDYDHDFEEQPPGYFNSDSVLDDIANSDDVQSPQSPARTQLQGHAQVYILADKYDIPGLKSLAKDKFEFWASYLFCPQLSCFPDAIRFLDVIPYVYTYAPSEEKGLRASIVKTWRLAPEIISVTLGNQRLQVLLERFPELALDLVKGLLTQADVRKLSNEATNPEELFYHDDSRQLEDDVLAFRHRRDYATGFRDYAPQPIFPTPRAFQRGYAGFVQPTSPGNDVPTRPRPNTYGVVSRSRRTVHPAPGTGDTTLPRSADVQTGRSFDKTREAFVRNITAHAEASRAARAAAAQEASPSLLRPTTDNKVISAQEALKAAFLRDCPAPSPSPLAALSRPASDAAESQSAFAGRGTQRPAPSPGEASASQSAVGVTTETGDGARTLRSATSAGAASSSRTAHTGIGDGVQASGHAPSSKGKQPAVEEKTESQ